MTIKFRTLRADEIECRSVASQKNKTGVQLLLYKDSRCDMALLDEKVGAENWARRHYDCKGNLFCSVGIKCDNEWVWKDDAGAETGMAKEKGEASDSFKRACVNWGIGRELYTSPFIWIKLDEDETPAFANYKVEEIQYNENREITHLKIVDKKNKVRFNWSASDSSTKNQKNEEQPQKQSQDLLKAEMNKTNSLFSAYKKLTNKTGNEILKEIQSNTNVNPNDITTVEESLSIQRYITQKMKEEQPCPSQ